MFGVSDFTNIRPGSAITRSALFRFHPCMRDLRSPVDNEALYRHILRHFATRLFKSFVSDSDSCLKDHTWPKFAFEA